eukprot:54749_1
MWFILVLLFAQNCVSYYHLVDELENYINTNSTFALQVNQTFEEAGYGQNSSNPMTYQKMYQFFNIQLTTAPEPYNESFNLALSPFVMTLTGQTIINSRIAQEWMASYLIELKKYCNSINSTNVVPNWENYYLVNMSEFIVPTNGYQSFNDFFTRKFKPGMRTIDSPKNNSIITSPCDCNVRQIYYNLSESAMFNIKGESYNISEMLLNSLYAQQFKDGIAVQLELTTYQYHRYHSSITGFVSMTQQIAGANWYRSNYYNKIPSVQSNRRGTATIETQNIGTIVTVYVGVDIDGSVNIHDIAGIDIQKGKEVGYFAYGGSTIVILFQKNAINRFTVDIDQVIQVGQRIAIANKDNM